MKKYDLNWAAKIFLQSPEWHENKLTKTNLCFFFLIFVLYYIYVFFLFLFLFLITSHFVVFTTCFHSNATLTIIEHGYRIIGKSIGLWTRSNKKRSWLRTRTHMIHARTERSRARMRVQIRLNYWRSRLRTKIFVPVVSAACNYQFTGIPVE